MRKEGAIHNYGAENKPARRHIDQDLMKRAQNDFKEQGIYKAKDSLENVSKRRFAIIAEVKKSLPELKNSQAITAFDEALEKNPNVWKSFSEAKTQEDIDAIASAIVAQLEREMPVKMPDIKQVGETSPDEVLEMPADEDELQELDEAQIEEIPEPVAQPQKAQIATAYGGHVAEAAMRGESMESIAQQTSQNVEQVKGVTNIDSKTVKQKTRENAVNIARAKIEAGMDPDDLQDSLEGELEELEATIEELEDDEPVTLDAAVTKAEAVRAQLKWLAEQKESAT